MLPKHSRSKFSQYSTITHAEYTKKEGLNEHENASIIALADIFSDMVKIALQDQRQGTLTEDSLYHLIQVLEVVTPQEKLIILLNDLETYRNLQMLNSLLEEGKSITLPKDDSLP